MGYRNPTQLQTTLNPLDFKKPGGTSDTGSGLSLTTKLAQESLARKKANHSIRVSNDVLAAATSADLSGQIAKTSKIDQASLNNAISGIVDSHYTSKTNLEQSVEPYEVLDDDGNLLYSYESDVQNLKNTSSFIKTFPEQLVALKYIQDEFTTIGTGENQYLPDNVNPYFNLLTKVDDPNFEGVNVKYDVTNDDNGIPQIGVVLYGSEVERINKEMGQGEKDAYTIRPAELTSILNNANGNPNDFGLTMKNHAAVGSAKKELETGGVISNGTISSDYMTPLETETIQDKQSMTQQAYAVSAINHQKLDQAVNPKAKAQTTMMLNYGQSSAATAIKQYANKTKEGQYYYDPIVWNPRLNKYVRDASKRVQMGDGVPEYDPQNTENDDYNGFPEQTFKNIEGLIRTKILEESGALMNPVKTKSGTPTRIYTDTEKKLTAKEQENLDKKARVETWANAIKSGKVDINDQGQMTDWAKQNIESIGNYNYVEYDLGQKVLQFYKDKPEKGDQPDYDIRIASIKDIDAAQNTILGQISVSLSIPNVTPPAKSSKTYNTVVALIDEFDLLKDKDENDFEDMKLSDGTEAFPGFGSKEAWVVDKIKNYPGLEYLFKPINEGGKGGNIEATGTSNTEEITFTYPNGDEEVVDINDLKGVGEKLKDALKRAVGFIDPNAFDARPSGLPMIPAEEWDEVWSKGKQGERFLAVDGKIYTHP